MIYFKSLLLMSSECAETTFFSKMGQKFIVTKPKKLVLRKKNEKPVVIEFISSLP